MSNEELMKPRYKLIADYPTCEFLVGDIFTFELTTDFDDLDGNSEVWYDAKNGVFMSTVVKYPHLFQKLEWHVGLAEEEKPKYLKCLNDAGDIDFVVKVEKYLKFLKTDHWSAFEYLWENEPDLKRTSLIGWIPATKEEYELSR